MTEQDTIAALATPPGIGGVGVIRVSGPACRQIAASLLGSVPTARVAEYHVFKNTEQESIDAGLALFFPAPNSFTGEDVLELQGHGGPVVMDQLLECVLLVGARLARPGEFSQRAFLNDKLDLAQAEAIADLIESGSVQAARAALRSLQGVFSQRIHKLVEGLIALRSYVEAAIDFPEEEVDFLADTQVETQLHELFVELDAILASADQGRLMRDGMRIVLAGQPNAGKSSLLNALSQQETAIVTEIPGTTRDVLREELNLDGLPLHIIDTAGLREGGNRIEQEGMRRTWREIEQAERILLVIDESLGFQASDTAILKQFPKNLPVSVIHNKIDLVENVSGESARADVNGYEHLYVSAKNGTAMESLREHLKQMAGFRAGMEGNFSARRRHLDALNSARIFMQQGEVALKKTRSGELLAEDLRQAQLALSQITGEFTSDDLLGEIFSSFCIGK